MGMWRGEGDSPIFVASRLPWKMQAGRPRHKDGLVSLFCHAALAVSAPVPERGHLLLSHWSVFDTVRRG